MNPLIQFKKITIMPLLIALAFACFALSPSVQAAPDPAPPPGSNTRDGAGSMAHVTTGLGNTAFGSNALFTLTTGDSNAAQGASALFSCTDGNSNTAVGNAALRFLTIGDQNVAIGNTALQALTTGSRNTAIGYGTLRSGNFSENTAVGWSALISNANGTLNVAVGSQALPSNTTGLANTAVGAGALFTNTEGKQNVASGTGALFSNTTGSLNIALGWNAGRDLTMGNNNIDIFNVGVAGESNTIRIGTSPLQTATYIAGISGATVSSGVAVFVNTDGKLGTLTSSARFKDEIKPMDKASEAILALKPVTFHYKKEIDPKSIPQFGLVAEEVAKVNPDLVVREADGKVYSVRYEAVNAMLLNEFLKEHRKNEEQGATIAELKKEIAALTATVKDQAAQIQKVSDKVELSRPAPQVAENNP
jgi:hypothetical protein